MANRIEFETFVNPAGFKAGLMQMEAAADATNVRLQNRLRTKLAGVESRMSGMDANSWEYVQAANNKARLEKRLLDVQNAMYVRNATARAAISKREVAATATAESEKVAANRAALSSITVAEREQAILEQHLMDESVAKNAAAAAAKAEANKMAWIAGQAEWRKIQEVQTAEMLANFEVQRVSNAKLAAEQVAANLMIARGFGAGGGGPSGGHGGFAGIIRESLVIVRELSMGRGSGRVAGSVTLLAQYLGLLGKVIHSTATEAVLASDAATNLSQALNLQALSAKGTAAYSELNAAALVAESRAAELAEKKEIALLNAKVKLNAVGWSIIGIGVLLTALYAVWKLYSNIALARQKFISETTSTNKKFLDEAESIEAAAKAHEDLNRWMAEELTNRKTLVDATEARIKQLERETEAQKELMRARGASAIALNNMDIAELKAKLEEFKMAEAKAKSDLETAKSRLASADAANAANATGGATTLKTAQGGLKATGEVIDAIEKAALNDPILMALKAQKAKGLKIAEPLGLLDAGLGGLKPEPGAPSGIGLPIGQAIEQRKEWIENKHAAEEFGSSLNDAEIQYRKQAQAVADLEKAQSTLAEETEAAKGDVKAANEAQKKFAASIKDIQAELGIKSGIGRQVAAAQDAAKFGKGSGSDSMVKVGNFLGEARSGIRSLAEKQIKLAEQSLHHLRSIDNKMGTHENSGASQFSGF